MKQLTEQQRTYLLYIQSHLTDIDTIVTLEDKYKYSSDDIHSIRMLIENTLEDKTYFEVDIPIFNTLDRMYRSLKEIEEGQLTVGDLDDMIREMGL
jgi:hypothetical protein